MTIADAVFLGIIQGLTEFLPISSSGHLVIAQSLLGVIQPGNEFEVLVHIGTLMSVLVVFKADIFELLFNIRSKNTQKYISFIILGTVPAVFIGLGYKDFIGSLFDNLRTIGIALIFTGIVLFNSQFAIKKNLKHSIYTALLIGCAQAIAIIPGVSRSGMTISMALFLGFLPREAARFSFLLAIPAISGAGILTMIDLNGSSNDFIITGIIGMSSSFLVGFFALKWLLGWLEKGKIYYFGIYCFLIGLFTLFS
jgi:undecaprenyl-diphosphatase